MPQSLETGKFDKYIGGKYFKDIGVWVCVCMGGGVGGWLIGTLLSAVYLFEFFNSIIAF